MINKAKCKLCKSIIESIAPDSKAICSCGEISVEGGESMRCSARNFDNFLRIDDEGNEITVTVKDKHDKEYMLKMLSDFLQKIEEMPSAAMYSSVNHYDLYTALTLVYAIFKAKD